MEAVALHDFQAGSNDELSFKRGNILKVLFYDERRQWYKAELDGNEGFIPSNYIRMTDCNWYFGKITRNDAEVLLKKPNVRDGHFLIRQCENSPGEFSINIRFQDFVKDLKVFRRHGKYSLWLVKFRSLNELVNYHRKRSLWQNQRLLLQDSTVETNLVRGEGALKRRNVSRNTLSTSDATSHPVGCAFEVPAKTSKSFGHNPSPPDLLDHFSNNFNPCPPTDPEEIDELQYRRRLDEFVERENLRILVELIKSRRQDMVAAGFPVPILTGNTDMDYLRLDFNNNNGN